MQKQILELIITLIAFPQTAHAVCAQDPVGWCGTSWIDIEAGTVKCTACASDTDCGPGVHCYRDAWCTGGVLCGDPLYPECADPCGSDAPPTAPVPSPPPAPVPFAPDMAPAPPPPASRAPRVVQYYAQWAVYGRNFFPDDVRVDQITHVHYAFYEVDSACRVASIDPWADYDLYQVAAEQPVYGNIAAFRALRAQQAALGRELKLAVSLGGWTRSTYFSGCAKTAVGRQTVVQTAVSLLELTDFDGVDVDWEYPVCCGLDSNEVDPSDWDNYLLLLRELREAMDATFPEEHKELTIAMGMSDRVTGVAPKAELGEILDAINLMTYDYNGAWLPLTAHNAPLYADPDYEAAGGSSSFNIDWGVHEWLAVVPSNKLVLGLPSYGRGWIGTSEEYGSSTGPVAGSPPWYEEGLLSYWDLEQNYVNSPLFVRHWNPVSNVPFLTSTSGSGTFITYDDAESIAIKARYARDLNLGGLMWWEASEDPESLLLLAANAAWQDTSGQPDCSEATQVGLTQEMSEFLCLEFNDFWSWSERDAILQWVIRMPSSWAPAHIPDNCDLVQSPPLESALPHYVCENFSSFWSWAGLPDFLADLAAQ